MDNILTPIPRTGAIIVIGNLDQDRTDIIVGYLLRNRDLNIEFEGSLPVDRIQDLNPPFNIPVALNNNQEGIYFVTLPYLSTNRNDILPLTVPLSDLQVFLENTTFANPQANQSNALQPLAIGLLGLIVWRLVV